MHKQVSFLYFYSVAFNLVGDVSGCSSLLIDTLVLLRHHSVHEQNFFLYFYGAAFNLLGVFGVMAFSRLSWVDVFRGHSLVGADSLPPCSGA